MVIFLLFCFIYTISFAQSNNKIQLIYDPEIGNIATQKMVMVGNTIVNAYGKEVITDLETIIVLRQTIRNKDDNGNFEKSFDYNSIKREVAGRLVNESIDCSYDYDFSRIVEELIKSKKTAAMRFHGKDYYAEKNSLKKNEKLLLK